MSEPDKILSIELIDPIVEPIEDKVYRLAATAAAAASIVDFGAINALFQTFITSPSERRTRKAIVLIIEAINDIKQKINRTEEQLQNDEAFVSTAAKAYSLATLTAEPEKLSAIKQAIISSASERAPSEAVQQMYLNSLADMTSIHLGLLGYFKSLSFSEVRQFNTGDRSVQNSYFEKAKPFTPDGTHRSMIERATTDLHSSGVIAIPEGCPQAMPGPNFIVMMLSEFGKGLIEFIEK